MTFRVGQKVVCVDVKGCPDGLLVRGRIYTIATIKYFDGSSSFHRGYGVTLEELPAIETEDFWAEYKATRFRPVVERKTDISVFHEILRTTKAPVNADAGCFVGSHEEKAHG